MSMTIIDAQQVELELARKLFWLMARDKIFFSTYDERIDDWNENGSFPAINTNDILVPGADAESLHLEDIDKYIEVCKRYGNDAEYIWCIAKNNMKPWRNPNDLTDLQKEGVKFACYLLGTLNPYANQSNS